MGGGREIQGTFEALLGPESTPDPVSAAQVAVAVPIPHTLTYAIPPEWEGKLAPGQRVRVPVGGRTATGFVVSLEESTIGDRLKPVDAVLEPTPSLTPTTLALGLWVARHYGAAPGEALQALVPAAVRHGRRLKEDVLVSLVDPDDASAQLLEHRDSPAWLGRCKVLRSLLEAGEPLRQQELLRIAHVSTSPVMTLTRAGMTTRRRVPALKDPFALLRPQPTSPPVLTPDQAAALETLQPLLESRRFAAALLHGVTGSGKTEVYLRLIDQVLAQGRAAILLVPEIALTPQTVERILGRVSEVAVLHSGLSDGDRAEQWERLRCGRVKVAVGPRSALFAPLGNVGLIILDEEHETTFKQQQSPRYHARDVALERARLSQALVVLGSATPSLESEGLARSGALTRISMPRRVLDRPLPPIDVIDMRTEKPVGPGGIFSRPLLFAMEEALADGGQIMLFLNRRGFSTAVLCRVCGWKASCVQCTINLTHYRASDRLLCHYCGHETPAPRECPDCASPHVRFGGFGTEKVAAAANDLFPGRRIQRMDGETLRSRGAPERIFRDLTEGRIDILVGTQVLAKGLDVPGITLVGVVSADTALLIPDFRSAERTFQLLCQVAGRAGRGERGGRVIVQSYCPDHESIQLAARHDHDGFVRWELRHREALGYPPAGHLLRVVVESPKSEVAATKASEVADACRASDAVRAGSATVMGPAPCPIPQIKGQHRFHLLFMAREADTITSLIPHIPRRSGRDLRILIDRDPVALM